MVCPSIWSSLYSVPGEAIDALVGPGEKLKLRSLCRARESELTCPSDGRKLGEAKICGVTVDLCLACNGLWLDAGELEVLRKSKPATPYQAPEKDATLYPKPDSGLELALLTTGLW